METLEHLRKVSKVKLVIMSLSTLLPIVILLVLELVKLPVDQNSAYADLVIFRYGILVLLEGYIGMKIANYIRILTNVDYASNELLKKNDERNRFIRLKTESMTIKIAIYSLAIAMLVTAFIHRLIFYTLLIVLLVYIVVYLVVKLYYWKKY